jgi:hypothetical protein
MKPHLRTIVSIRETITVKTRLGGKTIKYVRFAIDLDCGHTVHRDGRSRFRPGQKTTLCEWCASGEEPQEVA